MGQLRVFKLLDEQIDRFTIAAPLKMCTAVGIEVEGNLSQASMSAVPQESLAGENAGKSYL